MKKIISILLVAMMLLSLITVTVSAEDGPIVVTQDNVTELISNGIVTFAEDTKYTLGGNIDLSELVVSGQSILISDGVELDGAGYALTTSTKGAFMTVNSATIKNISIGTTSKPIDASGSASLVVGVEGVEATWTDVDFFVINNYASEAKYPIVGGFSQSLRGTMTFENCTMTAVVSLTTGKALKAGGWFGTVAGESNLTMKNCTTYGSVEINQYGFVSAHIGSREDLSSGTVKFENCANYASVTGVNGANATAFVYNRSAEGTVELKNCVNYADITATGFDGTNPGTAGMISSNKAATVKATTCMNIGKITAEKGGNIVGTGNVTVDTCYAFGTAPMAIDGDGTVSGTGNRTVDTYTNTQNATAMSLNDAVALVNSDSFALGTNNNIEEIKAVENRIVLAREIGIAMIILNETDVKVRAATNDEKVVLVASTLPGRVSPEELVWSSSDDSILTVNNGELTPVAIGEVTVTVSYAKDPNIKATCKVRVVDPVKEVEEMISAIPNPVTLASRSAISAAERAYKELTPEQQALVSNYSVLTDARAAYNALLAGGTAGDSTDGSGDSTDNAGADNGADGAADAGSDGDTETEEEEGGCGSAFGAGVALIGMMAVGACVVFKKKETE